MKFIMPLLIFGFVIWVMVKIFRFFQFLSGIVNATAQKQQLGTKTSVRPAPKRPSPVQSVPDDNVAKNIDRAFEGMGLALRFGHLNAEAKKMLKKAWAIRTPVISEENAPVEGQNLEPSSEPMLIRENTPVQDIRTDNTLHFAFCTSHSPLQQWVVQNEILSPPLALREEG
jgi:hypothetical protein